MPREFIGSGGITYALLPRLGQLLHPGGGGGGAPMGVTAERQSIKPETVSLLRSRLVAGQGAQWGVGWQTHCQQY